MLALVDRATRDAMVVALLDGNKADAVAAALIDHMSRLPAHLRRSLTWDRGSEMAHHAVITTALALPVFFCDPHHRWQPSVAARHQREHEPAAAPISAQQRRPGSVHPGRPQRRRCQTQPSPASSPWLGQAGPGVGYCRAETDAAGACLAGAVSGLQLDRGMTRLPPWVAPRDLGFPRMDSAIVEDFDAQCLGVEPGADVHAAVGG